jgi:hypothetical protein
MADSVGASGGGPGGGAEPGSHGPGNDEVAELVWRIGEDVDPPVTIVVNGREYEVGAGPPQGRVEMTVEELRAAAARAEAGEDRDLTD